MYELWYRMTQETIELPIIPRQSLLQLFLRFLRFGFLAWGGPVAQIGMIRQELVEEEQWVTRARFNRVLSIYQILPGPEAHELCVYFGMLARGRLGGLLAGLGFMLPGFALMFALSWFYTAYGLSSPLMVAVFSGFQPAVVALIFRAVHRIGSHALTHRWLWIIAGTTLAGELLGVPFWITLMASGVAYVLARRGMYVWLPGLLVLVILLAALALTPGSLADKADSSLDSVVGPPSQLALLWYGLRSGLLTFGGAYTVIAFLQHDAVVMGAFMTNEQFLDGLALSGILPAPLIIFATFVGYIGGGPLGALVLTFGIFLPAFSFTLIAHDYLEKLVEKPGLHNFLDGVTAGVVGLISATALQLAVVALDRPAAFVLFGVSLLVLFVWHSKAAVAVIVLCAGALGFLLSGL
jgi:chromate transporter